MMLTGMHGDHLVALVGRVTSDEDASRAARLLAPHFGPGPVVIGRRAMDFDAVGISIRAATAAVHAADAWPQAPRPVSTDELLPERAIAGDVLARAELIESVYSPLAGEEHLLATAEAFLEQSPSLGGNSPPAVRAPQYGALPTGSNHRHHRVLGNRPSRVAHPALGPDAGANILRGLVFVGNLQSLSADFGP